MSSVKNWAYWNQFIDKNKPLYLTSDSVYDKPTLCCPICGFDYVHFSEPFITGIDDGHKQLYIPMWGECGASWKIIFDHHEGNTFLDVLIDKSCRSEPKIDYQNYIQSPEWKRRASEAKRRVGYRCQICNRPSSEIQLDAHHRTYERLGMELPEDITVLCRDCHKIYHNKHR